jgi:glycosyltransferase involved in cell wall biosynthesis
MKRGLRIAQVAPLIERVPPEGYGGTERVVSWLTEELVRQGHHVTLFATGDSRTSAVLVPCADRALRTPEGTLDPIPWHLAMLERVEARARSFDVVHYHTELLHLPIARRSRTPSITTLHGRLDIPGCPELLQHYDDVQFVSISDAQRKPAPRASWLATVYHGLPKETYARGDGEGDYLVFLGRFSREKRPDRAIEISVRSGVALEIAAKVDPADRDYFVREVQPLLSTPGVHVVGEVDERQKRPLLGRARALVFPIDWPEPFGLVMIEAMLCGTPVIGFRAGSVPEIVDDGVTGFVVDDIDGAVRAVEQVRALDRRKIRAVAEARFSAPAMAARYVGLYERLAASVRAA